MELQNIEFERFQVTNYIDGYVLEIYIKRTDVIPTLKFATEKFSDLILIIDLIK